jgi:hypothetical protein
MVTLVVEQVVVQHPSRLLVDDDPFRLNAYPSPMLIPPWTWPDAVFVLMIVPLSCTLTMFST